MRRHVDAMDTEEDRLLDSAEVGLIFGVGPESVIRWLHAGKIEYKVKTLGGQYRFSERYILALKERNSFPPREPE